MSKAVVHCRQVVVDQRIAVNAFQRSTGEQRRVARYAEDRRTLHHQKRPQALSSAQARIAHGIHQPFRPCDFVGQQCVGEKPCEQCFGVLRGLVQSFREVGRWRRGRHLEKAPSQIRRTIVDDASRVNCTDAA
jgi:hypothetical protein